MRWLVVVLTLCSCSARQAPVARSVGKVLALGGVAGLIGSSLASRFTGHGQELLLGFSIASGTGIVTYAAGDLSQPEIVWVPEPIPQRNHRWAKILTERAFGAARDGRCARVRRLERRVHNYDSAWHDVVFMKDPAVLKCLSVPSPTVDPPPQLPDATPLSPP